jgi:hypothetical protein
MPDAGHLRLPTGAVWLRFVLVGRGCHERILALPRMGRSERRSELSVEASPHRDSMYRARRNGVRLHPVLRGPVAGTKYPVRRGRVARKHEQRMRVPHPRHLPIDWSHRSGCGRASRQSDLSKVTLGARPGRSLRSAKTASLEAASVGYSGVQFSVLRVELRATGGHAFGEDTLGDLLLLHLAPKPFGKPFSQSRTLAHRKCPTLVRMSRVKRPMRRLRPRTSAHKAYRRVPVNAATE